MACYTSQDPGGCGCGCSQTFAVKGCNGLAYSGVTVEVYQLDGTTFLTSGTTDGSGMVTLSWPGSNSVVVKVTGISARFQAYSQSFTVACGGSTTLTLTAASGFICLDGPSCLLPVKNVLHLTENTLGVSGSITFSGDWVGSFPYSYPGKPNPGGCPAATVTLNFRLRSSDGALSVDFQWTGFGCPADGPFNDLDTMFYTPGAVSCPPGFNLSFSRTSAAMDGIQQNLFLGAAASVTITE